MPAYLANATPPLIKNIKFFKILGKPIDGGKKLKEKELFGSHKTWRGLIGMLVVGIAASYILFFLENRYNLGLYENIGFDYTEWSPLLFGALMALGTIIGDLLFAFIKRRIRLKPGAPFIPFDQTNYVIGNFIILQPFLELHLSVWIILFFATLVIHIIFNRLGYLLGLHNAKW